MIRDPIHDRCPAMKPLFKHALALLLGATTFHAAHAGDWYAPQDPFQLYGDTYYVGTGGISAVLITSKAGHILVDVGGPDAPKQIVAHIRKLGFKVEDIRYILNTHDHVDHAGGIAALQTLSGATVVASPAALQVLQSGEPDKSDAQYPGLPTMTPIPAAKTRAVRDGETVRLGPLAVTAHYTPGHTKGGTSWTWQATEQGKTVDVVFADSLNAVAAKGLSFSRNPLYPNARADIERAMAAVAAMPCDVLVAAHPEQGGLWERKAKQKTLGDAAFIDRNACRAYVDVTRARLTQTLKDESAGTGAK
jgi:metallo-beta-lactamase class B